MSARLFQGFNISSKYAKYRVCPPQRLIDTILKYLVSGETSDRREWPVAVDVGCGSGQCTRLLTPYFKKVYGFDVSETQLKEALNYNWSSNVEFKTSSAESLSLDDRSVNLITASQSAHWFQLDKFYAEVDRLLVSKGVIALFGYKMPTVDNRTNSEFMNLILDAYRSPLLAAYWNKKERILVDTAYKDIVLPYKDSMRVDDIMLSKVMTVEDMIGNITSWSAYDKCKKNNPQDAEKLLLDFKKKCLSLVNDESAQLNVIYQFFLLMGRKP